MGVGGSAGVGIFTDTSVHIELSFNNPDCLDTHSVKTAVAVVCNNPSICARFSDNDNYFQRQASKFSKMEVPISHARISAKSRGVFAFLSCIHYYLLSSENIFHVLVGWFQIQITWKPIIGLTALNYITRMLCSCLLWVHPVWWGRLPLSESFKHFPRIYSCVESPSDYCILGEVILHRVKYKVFDSDVVWVACSHISRFTLFTFK